MDFVKWYRISESVLGNLIPHLSDQEIVSFVSDNKWLVVPTEYETDRRDSINRRDPAMFINLSEKGKIGLGIVYNTLASVERLRNILHTFHSLNKDELLKGLNELDDEFMTTVERKTKHYYFGQTPEYEEELKFHSNKIDSSSIFEIFKRADQIRHEGRREMKRRGIHWNPILPHINLAITWTERNEDVFRAKLEELKPIYEIVLRIKTDREIKDEEARLEKEKEIERKKKFALFVEELSRGKVPGEEWRRLVSEWYKENA